MADLEGRTDNELAAAILAGEPGAFEALHARHRERIFRFAVKRLRDAAEAEDVTQEVFLQVHRCLATFEGRSTLLTWMFGIAHNQVCRRFRRQRPTIISMDAPEVSELPSGAVPPDRCVEAARGWRRCEKVLADKVSEPQRAAFHLRYAESRSTREIAQRLGKSNQAVKIGLFRSRRTLAENAPELLAMFGA